MKVLLVLPTIDKGFGGPIVVVEKLVCQLKKNNLDVEIFPNSLNSNLFMRLLKLFILIPKFDLIHIHCIWSIQNSIVSLFARFYNVPYILTPHGMLDNWSVKQKKIKKLLYFFLIEKSNFKNAKYAHFLNSEELVEANQFYKFSRSVIIPNGSDLINNKSNESYLNYFIHNLKKNNKVILLYLGRIHPKKGLNDLLLSFSEVLKVQPDFHLIIAGGGDNHYIDNLNLLLSTLSINEKVTFLGPIYGQDKFYLFTSSDIFILPSFQEGDSVAIKEAMSNYLPVIITKACHFKDVEIHKAGIIVENNINQIKNAILFLNNKGIRTLYGRNGHNLIKRKYTWEILSYEYYKIYLNVIHNE